MKKAIQMIVVAMLAVSAGTASTHAQTAAETDASLDALFGAHAPYRQFFEQLQKAVGEDDRATVAAMVDYPFQARIDGKAVKLRDAAHFVADYDKIVTTTVKRAIAGQTYETLFANWQGVMIGDGELWFSGVGDAGPIRITAIND